MSEKQYFKIEYDEEWYLFDSTTISEQLVKEQAEYDYGVFANSLSPSEICDRLNALHEENQELKKKNNALKEDINQSEKRVKHWMMLYEDVYDKMQKRRVSG